MFKYFRHRKNLQIISIIALFALVLHISPSNTSAYPLEENKLQNISVNPLFSSSSSEPSYSVLDPNPILIDEDGNLNNNISLAASISTDRIGTIADNISKLILVIKDNKALQFSIEGRNSTDITDGRLSRLDQSKVNSLFSNTTVSPQNISNGESVVVAVYTPPDSFNQDKGSNRTININVNASNPNDRSVSIQLYRPPVVLVHGIWTNSIISWIGTGFVKPLSDYGFSYTFADYGRYNSTTFDPYYNKTIGNYGIDAIRNKINDTINHYHNNKSIAASQVDIVAHSMGGLMARGFVQQDDYKGKENYMKGSIHRLITIGTPHFGGHLSEFLYEHRDDWYCIDGTHLTPAQNCKVEPKKLRTIYADNLHSPIDKGGVEALIPGSDAYSCLCRTNLSSYAIAGSWKPNATDSHESQEWDYQFITDNLGFNLDRDGFHDDNDLVVSVNSQLGGLQNQIRQPEDNDVPNNSSIYPNTVHAGFLVKRDQNVSSELNSIQIQNDVIRLLSSSDNNKFADAIGIGSPCNVPK